MQPAALIKSADGLTIAIKAGFNTSLVNDIKMLTGRRWNSTTTCWEIPAAGEPQARAILRRYGPITDELNTAPTTTLHVLIRAEASRRRTHLGRVLIDGIDVVTSTDGALNLRPNAAFTIVTVNSARFLSGSPRHAYAVEYDLVITVRDGARWGTTSTTNCFGDYTILA